MLGIKNGWKKAEAAAILETLFEKQKLSAMFTGDHKRHANEIVSNCWERAPQLLNGSRGPRPTRFSLAAISLADAIKYVPGTEEDKLYLMFSLRELLEGVSGFPDEAIKSAVDEKLFEIAADALDNFSSDPVSGHEL